MLLELERKYFRETYTIGALFVDGAYLCDVLEDRYRDLLVEPKVDGQTCIPYGAYKVILSFSNRFQRVLPELLNVPQFTGIRIHGGNTSADTEGCILVGKNNVVAKVTDSQYYLSLLMERLNSADNITINISRA